jgi:hypothetical protein
MLFDAWILNFAAGELLYLGTNLHRYHQVGTYSYPLEYRCRLEWIKTIEETLSFENERSLDDNGQ